ncbi:DUF433 domain-containing protein [Candidatus Poribacteria bacterium]|nr:DUF433 domain-containing protein [Candidatus Poribacteria bacterium]
MLSDFPYLEEEDIRQALDYAAALVKATRSDFNTKLLPNLA